MHRLILLVCLAAPAVAQDRVPADLLEAFVLGISDVTATVKVVGDETAPEIPRVLFPADAVVLGSVRWLGESVFSMAMLSDEPAERHAAYVDDAPTGWQVWNASRDRPGREWSVGLCPTAGGQEIQGRFLARPEGGTYLVLGVALGVSCPAEGDPAGF
ncbi:MAG: hypothetical protein AAGK21_11790 [Bacteroidota bacterium]